MTFSGHINDLPDEVVCAILTLAINPRLPGSDISRLELTCQKWRNLVEHVPSFWANITPCHGMKYVEEALLKSRNAGIDIYFKQSGSNIIFAEFLVKIDPHILRWRSLELELDAATPDLGALEWIAPPQLERLHISQVKDYDDYEDSEAPLVSNMAIFGGGEWPGKLRDVAFQSFPVRIEQLQLRSLTRLRLQDLRGIHLATVVEILRASPCIEFLYLGGRPSIQSDKTVYTPIDLIFLECAVLFQLGLSTVCSLLSAIRIPSCCRLSIDCVMDQHSTTATLVKGNLAHLYPVIRNMARNGEYIRVQQMMPLLHDITAGNFRFWIRVQNMPQMDEIMDWMMHIIDGDGEPPSSIQLWLCQLVGDWWYPKSPHSFKVKRIDFMETVPNMFSHGAVLQRVDQPQATECSWNCPNVEILRLFLTGYGGVKLFADILADRYGSAGHADKNGGDERTLLPKPLKEIHLSFSEISDVEKVVNPCFAAIHRATPNTEIFWGDSLQVFD